MKLILRDFEHKKGVHSDTTALRDVFAFAGHRFPEELFFGLGEGLGFYYWNGRNLARPMIGGRCGNLELDRRVCDKLGARLVIRESTSPRRARGTMLSLLEAGRPVMLHTDAYYLKFLRCDAHFGAHCLVVAGVDEDTAYVADRSRDGLIEMSLDELSEARSSRHRPFPPQNRWFEIDVPEQIDVDPKALMGAIGMNATEMLNSPIRNVGIGGIYYFANCVRTWDTAYGKKDLPRVCREAHDAIEGDGIGGGCFRYLYADFLQYAGRICDSRPLAEVADGYRQVGNMWTQMASMFAEVDCGCASLTEIATLANAIAAKEHELQVSLMTAANLCCRRH
ncbi:MAG: hypothetical protein A4E28_02560 [Methanocella sp. PtaU1.Bin125]|nr:MAG: hypothetical protein A4E28_02560 [Methanocella sp. PtaU1.Bin125]